VGTATATVATATSTAPASDLCYTMKGAPAGAPFFRSNVLSGKGSPSDSATD
jgi:hypothetical protein